jgi:hypothetical protein
VAVVTGDPPGQPRPDVVNGDRERTGFSVVATATDQVQVPADAGDSESTLTGYVTLP